MADSNQQIGTQVRLARLVFGAAAGADSGAVAANVAPAGTAAGCYRLSIPAGSLVSDVTWSVPSGATAMAGAAGAQLAIVLLNGSNDSLIAGTAVAAGLGRPTAASQSAQAGAVACTIGYTVTDGGVGTGISAGAVDIFGTVTPALDGAGQGA